MKRPLRTLPVILLALGCGLLAGCQGIPAFLGLSKQAAVTSTPFQPIPPTAAPSTPMPTPLRLPDAAASTAQVEQCAEQHGKIEVKEAVFTPGGAPFHFRVYLPPCYESGQGAPYPVLYMIHGQTFNDDQWQRLGIAEAADALIGSRNAPPFMVVMPREEDTFADIYQSSFSSSVIDGLIPWIDASYLTCPQRECRAVGGLSRGGAWALHLGFTHWELFSAIGAHSTPPFNNTPRLFPGWVEQIPAGSLPRVYMDIGRRDPYLSMASDFEALLVKYGVPHEWYLFNGTHEEAYWSAHLAGYLAWYAAGWAAP